MDIKRKRLNVIGIALTFCALIAFLFTYWMGKKQEELVLSVKDAEQIDVYLFVDGKVTLFSSLQYNYGLSGIFGDEDQNVFGRESLVDDYDDLLYPKGAGILLRFQFQNSIVTLDVYCHKIMVETELIRDNIIPCCFSDYVNEDVFLVEVDTGIKLSEPKMRTEKMHDPDGKFYEIIDTSFFSDIKQLLRERFYLDAL